MKLSRVALLMAAAGSAALAQNVISAKSGTLQYVEGNVYANDKLIELKVGNYPDLKEKAVLRAEDGRAEVLLTPGVFLRVAEDSSFRMVTNRLIDTRIEFLAGSIILEADELPKDNNVTVVYQDYTVHLSKAGLYRFNSTPADFRVYAGEAELEGAGRRIEVGAGKLVRLEGELAVEKFDKNTGDAFSRWSRRRGENIAIANISAAKSLRESERGWRTSGWFWNPYFGMFTFIPGRGTIYSPYGYRFWSPVTVYRVYEQPVYSPSPSAMSAPSYPTMRPTSGGYSGTVAASSGSVSAPTTSAAGASSAPVARESGSAGGRSR